MKKLSIMAATLVGAIAAYLWDPDNGKARRARARDQTSAALDSLKRETAAKAKHQRNVVEGWAHEIGDVMRPPRQFDDGTLVQKVRSEVIGGWTAEGNPPVDVEVSDGRVTVATTLDHPDRLEELLDRIRSVDGVEDARLGDAHAARN
jgi:hypothetical protein